MTPYELAKKYEHYVTPKWAAEAILDKEILTRVVIDPAAGTCVLSETASRKGYECFSGDIHDWTNPNGGDSWLDWRQDFLKMVAIPTESDFTVFMNPPFSKAVEFVEKSLELGAHKVLCFQRLAFFCSQERRDFWDKNPPVRIHLCAERATCWRHDIPLNARGKRFNPETGKEYAETPTDHAWFVFESGYTGSTSIHRLYKKS